MLSQTMSAVTVTAVSLPTATGFHASFILLFMLISFCQKPFGSSLVTLKSGYLPLKHGQFGDEYLSKSFGFSVMCHMYV